MSPCPTPQPLRISCMHNGNFSAVEKGRIPAAWIHNRESELSSMKPPLGQTLIGQDWENPENSKFPSLPHPSVPSCTYTDPKQGELEKYFHVFQKGNVRVATKPKDLQGTREPRLLEKTEGNILELDYVICQPSYKQAGRCVLNYYLYTSSSENRNIFLKALTCSQKPLSLFLFASSLAALAPQKPSKTARFSRKLCCRRKSFS